MKRIRAVNPEISSLRIREFLAAGRTFVLLSLCSMIIFVLAGAASIVRHQDPSSPASSMKGLTSMVSSAFLADMLGMEMPAFQSSGHGESVSTRQVSSFVLRMLTDVNPGSPRSLLAAGMPVMQSGGENLAGKASAAGGQTPEPEDEPEAAAGDDSGEDGHDAGIEDDSPVGPIGVPQDDPAGSGQSGPESSGAGSGTPPAAAGGSKAVFIYHSHIRESYNPEVSKPGTNPESSKVNVANVGERLAEELEKRGVGAVHSSTDYPSVIPGFKYTMSYKYSKKSVQEAMSANKGLKFFFDIHRDSAKRKTTTVSIGGKDYAKVFFIIGRKNPNWEENEKFAEQIHNMLNERYPGLSRGIWGKTVTTGNGEYNQSLASDSVLVEVGGIDNSLEEGYRTADALAEVIADLYFEGEKA
ncbi:stage II sporulation protein P [Paenibacillus sp. D51F]